MYICNVNEVNKVNSVRKQKSRVSSHKFWFPLVHLEISSQQNVCNCQHILTIYNQKLHREEKFVILSIDRRKVLYNQDFSNLNWGAESSVGKVMHLLDVKCSGK